MKFLFAKEDITALFIVFGILIVLIFLTYLTNRPKKEENRELEEKF